MGCNICSCQCYSEQQRSLEPQKSLPYKSQPQPFFDGQILQQRMSYIRQKFIETVREKYDRNYFEENMKKFLDLVPSSKSKKIISAINYYYWTDDASQNNMRFKLIRAFTNEQINQSIIRLINSILREKSIEDDQKFEFAVFLIEAINIELFLLTLNKPELHNFQGLVYRGFTCKDSDYLLFQKIKQKALENRVIAVPLSLWSSSLSEKVAQSFLQKRSIENAVNIMLAINVISINQNDLALYKSSFPKSVVSTICAVDISAKQLTQYTSEKQVLLRGAFCLVLDIEQIIKQGNLPQEQLRYKRINCVMVNANRDHISTNHLGDQSDAARNLFGSLARKARMGFAQNYFKAKQGKSTEINYFEEKRQIQEEKIRQFRRFRFIQRQ